MKKVRPISGFPEWLPEQKLIEDVYKERIAKVFESYGFTPIETPAAELVEVLAEQGITDKEIYGLTRIKDEDNSESQIGLRFDLTIPLSRYVAQHLNDLKFPFRRYQMQKVWRGERPQKGRFREFYQCDADVVARDELPLCCDAEIVMCMDSAFEELDIGKYQININNRKLVLGLLSSLDIDEQLAKEVLISVDKLDKIGKEGVSSELTAKGVSPAQSNAILEWCQVKRSASDYLNAGQLKEANELQRTGQSELLELLRLLPEDRLSRYVINPALVRGLDYYTGLIFEFTLPAHPQYGSVCGGGRYENLVSRFSNQKLPGVGASIGLTRLMDLIFSTGLHSNVSPRKLPQVLISVLDEAQRPICNKIAQRIRAHEIPTEVFIKTSKLGKQIEYADSRKIPFVLFASADGSSIEIKDLKLQSQQVVSDLDAWCKSLAASWRTA